MPTGVTEWVILVSIICFIVLLKYIVVIEASMRVIIASIIHAHLERDLKISEERALAKPAVFIDRDGVINVDHGYVSTVDDFTFIDGVFEACYQLKEMGYLLVVVTNQSGIARGYFSEDDFLNLTEWMDWNFADKGVDLDGIYYCPHHPDYGNEQYKKDCECRKPKAGMFFSAQKDLNIDLAQSIMIGDKADDMRAADAAGINTKILVRTGKVVTEEAQSLATVVLDSIKNVPEYLKLWFFDFKNNKKYSKSMKIDDILTIWTLLAK